MLKRTFDEWLRDIDRVLLATTGLSHNDLPDCCYRDWYDSSVPATIAAARARRAARNY